MNKFYQSKIGKGSLSAILIGGILVGQSSYVLAQEMVHTVSHGEYLYQIAQKYGVTVKDLQTWNQLTSNFIYTGDQLIVSKPLETTVTPVEETEPTVTTTTEPTLENDQVSHQESDINTTNPSDSSSQVTSKTYTIKPGDYLYKIATMYGVTVQQLKTWNQLTSNYIYAGNRLIVSQPQTQSVKPEQGATDSVTTKEITSPEIKEKPTPSPSPVAPSGKTYTVKSGDYLYKIASMYGVTIDQIKTWNNLSSNLIFTDQTLYVSKPGSVSPVEDNKSEKPTPQPSPEKPSTTPNTKANKTQAPATIYVVKPGDYLYKIGAMYGVTIDQIKAWNNLTSNYIYAGDRLIVSPGTSSTTETLNTNTGVQSDVHQGVQAVLNKYTESPIRVHFESLVDGDNRSAGLRPDSSVYGASVPKIVITSYVQDQIEKGNLTWDTRFPYSDAIYDHPESYAWGGSGSIQYQNNFRNKSYTVLDLVNKTLKESDNLASNMLLHYVGFKNKVDFDQFTQRVYGEPRYHRNITPRQYNKVLKHILGQKEKVVIKAMDQTIYDGTKIDAIPANTYQKIGAWWPHYNHSAGIVEGPKPFALTILTDYWSDSAIGSLAKQVYNAVINTK